ncbi:MAG TPA: hypothetical protein VIC08_01955 [Cellvibrionaceae bacterium]
MKSFFFNSVIIACALLLVACSESEYNAESNAPVKSVPVTVDNREPGRVKPGLSITLAEPQQQIPVGATAEINLSLTTGLTEGVLTVQLALPDQLALVEGQLRQEFDLATGRPEIQLFVRAEQEGKHYVPVMAELDRGQYRGRALSAIIWAGDAAELKARAALLKGDETGIVELPAEERH